MTGADTAKEPKVPPNAIDRRRRLLLVLAPVVVVVGAIGAIVLFLGPPERDPAPLSTPAAVPSIYVEDRPAALELARQACAILDAAVEQVRQDAAVEEVQELFARAERTAVRAYSHDVRWVRLLSAATALAAAIRDDDAEAARVGLVIADEECSAARADA